MKASERTWTKVREWNGKDLKGRWEFFYKIDGVRAFFTMKDGWVSRSGKPLYNLPTVWRGDGPAEGVEAYCNKPGRSSKANYKATIECVRAKTKIRPISVNELFFLPDDTRLRLTVIENPTAVNITNTMKRVVREGYEGLVLRQGAKWIKVKPVKTYDVLITEVIEGKGKHEGRMGALMTAKGKVGTGFSDLERDAIWGDRTNHIGVMIEVACMQLTPDGKFRHPRFVRFRYDK